MSTRDRAGEILEAKKRNPIRHRFGSFELERLQSQWTKKGSSEGSTPDFYVIRAVTLLEVFARGNVAELIDHGPEYANRAIELSKNLKIDFALVQGIQGRAITLGDIVAHNVSLNTFSQVFGCFETLVGKPVRPLLASAINRWAAKTEVQPLEPIIKDFDALARNLTRLFEVRHILCHEIPRRPVYDVGEISSFLNDAACYARALEELLTSERFGHVELTQTEMNIAAGEGLRKKEDELKALVFNIRARVNATDDKLSGMPGLNTNSSWLHWLDKAQENWLLYRNAQCDFVTYLNQAGTIQPMNWAHEATRLTGVRIAELRSWLELEEYMES